MLGDKYKDSIKLWGGQNDRGYVCIVVRLNTSGMLGDIGDNYADSIKLWGGQNDGKATSALWCV